MIKNIKPMQDRSILKDPILDDPPKQNWTVKSIGKIQLVRDNNPVKLPQKQDKDQGYDDYDYVDEDDDGEEEQDYQQEQEEQYDEDQDEDEEYTSQYDDDKYSNENDAQQQQGQSDEQFVQSQQTQREVEYIQNKDLDFEEEDYEEYEDNEEGEYEEEDDGVEILPPIKSNNQINKKYNQPENDNDQYNDDDDDDIEQRATQSKSKPILSNAAFRMLNFEIRKERPDLPRNIVKRTTRDETGRRVDEQPVNKIIPVKQQEEQPRKIIQQQSPQQVSPPQKLEQNKIQLLINKIKNKIHNNSNNNNTHTNNGSQIFETQNNKKWVGFTFTNEMATNSDIINARNLRSYSEIFEVDQNFEFDETLLIKPFIRSNQGKQDQEFRSANGLAKAMQRLIQIVVDQNRILKDGSYVTYDQIYEYVHDRIRAMLTEMTQVYACNQFDVTYFRIPLLEGIIRFYLYSYYQVLLQNTELTLGNIVQIKKSLGKNIATVCQDYVDLFSRIDCDDNIFKNVPEFVQYQYLLHYLEVKTSVAHIVEFGILLNEECPFYMKLEETNEFKFLKFVQEFIITKNLFGLVQLKEKETLSFYQSFFIYLIVESLQGFQSECKNKYLLNKNAQSFYPCLEEVFIALEQYEPDLKTYELLTGTYQQQQQQQYQQQQQQQQSKQQQSFQLNSKKDSQYDQLQKQDVPKKVKVVKENILKKFIELSQNMLKQQRFQEITLLKDRLEEFMGNNYYKNRIFKHWRLSILKQKNQKYYENLMQQPQSQLIERPTPQQKKQVFLDHLAFTIGNYYCQINEIIYKIVIIYDEFNNFNSMQSILFQSLFQEKLARNLQFDLKYQLGGEERILHLIIVSSTEFIQQEMCGTDLIISINKEDSNYQHIPTLQIQFNKVTEKKQNHKYLQYEDLEIFDNIFESIKFRNRLNKLIDISLNKKIVLPPVKAVSLVSVLSGIKAIQQNKYDVNSVHSFIYYCNLGQEYLHQIAKSNQINVSQLPQELYFTRYLVDQQANQYVQRFNLVIKLMIPFLNQLHQPYFNSNHLIQVINRYLSQFNDHFTYYQIFQKQFKFFKSSLSGDWELLFKQIIDDLIVYVEDSDQHFIVPLEFEFEIDHDKLQKQVEKDIKQLTSEKGQIYDEEIKKTQIDLFHTELVDWIKKKRKCIE